ncbi:deoxyribodipyrimidine photo-lyase [Paenarthrobacter sp. Z7-10]|uniref:cryptochrome/photolyase family protein n=1 Tax=Paenarthrobacter sp. Z7-10 TaxID=2787635 RepID=UPI0022A8F7F1|nr:deoxyribodipyrimidine photo-lyase [Paenarthrobacter sp. Z7-10]MCZ2404595.1 deoxyribodipyrimidine photo-lyase [Paenarthrobacter sp. Z7-10]
MGNSLVWLRDDLRLTDNPALEAACSRGGDVAVVYVLDEESEGIRALGGAAKWWLHGSLEKFAATLARLGAPLILRRGPAGPVLRELVAELEVDSVFWNRRYGLAERTVDEEFKTWLRDSAIAVQSFQANLLFEPWQVSTGAGAPYKVFTPFWRACTSAGEPRLPLPAPERINGLDARSDPLEAWNLRPNAPDWSGGLAAEWTPGETGAHDRLADFVDRNADGYALGRERPAEPATSKLSPHLRFGEISPFTVWQALRGLPGAAEDVRSFRTELGWREFCWQLLYFNPELATVNYRPEFNHFQWDTTSAATPSDSTRSWQRGRTGYPLVDAGMRQLWQTGWMHNRIRMVTASFLAKNLLTDWRVGEQWFWDTLVDADAASNSANWQWVAGSGADAAPYFRIFNPVTQSRKFDPEGTYLHRFLPELAAAEGRIVHEPWTDPAVAPAYPLPVVELGPTRQRALAAYAAMKAAAAAVDDD